jgi:hypothetical protein
MDDVKKFSTDNPYVIILGNKSDLIEKKEVLQSDMEVDFFILFYMLYYIILIGFFFIK